MTTMTRKVHSVRILVRWLPIPIALFAIGIVWQCRGGGFIMAGLQEAVKTLWDEAPLLSLALLLGLLIDQIIQWFLLPKTIIHRLRLQKGWRATGWSCLAGALFPAGPYAYYPVAGALMRSGTEPRLLIAFIAAKNLWAVTRLPLELALLGPSLTFTRIAVTFFMPPLLGVLAGPIFTQRNQCTAQAEVSTRRSGKSVWSLMVFLMIIFIITGYGKVIITPEIAQAWLGPSTGCRGILLAEGIGLLLPGGPYVVFPLAFQLYQAGAGIAAAVALITSSVMWALPTTDFELPFLGPGFMARRLALGLAFPFLAGILAQTF